VLQRSGVDAVVDVDAVPRSVTLRAQPLVAQRLCTLSGGDDYELLFTAPPQSAQQVIAAGISAGVALTRIGRIVERASAEREAQTALIDANGRAVTHGVASFDHFRT
jgi:thiamine-monophosphate kinase